MADLETIIDRNLNPQAYWASLQPGFRGQAAAQSLRRPKTKKTKSKAVRRTVVAVGKS